jgi:hypothetical protein
LHKRRVWIFANALLVAKTPPVGGQNRRRLPVSEVVHAEAPIRPYRGKPVASDLPTGCLRSNSDDFTSVEFGVDLARPLAAKHRPATAFTLPAAKGENYGMRRGFFSLSYRPWGHGSTSNCDQDSKSGRETTIASDGATNHTSLLRSAVSAPAP